MNHIHKHTWVNEKQGYGTIILCFIHPAMKRKSYCTETSVLLYFLSPHVFQNKSDIKNLFIWPQPPKKSSTFRLMFCSTPPRTFYWETAVIHVFDVWPRFLETAELFYRDNFPAFGDTQRSPRNHQHDWKTFSFRKNCQMQRHQLGFNPQKTTYLIQEFWQVHNYVHTLS